jgi:hypothetical protein
MAFLQAFGAGLAALGILAVIASRADVDVELPGVAGAD